MFGFVPKFHHLMVSIFIAIGFFALSAVASGRVYTAFNAGAVSFFLVAGVVLFLLVLEGLNHRVEIMTEFARAIGQLDDEARAMMAFEFPHMRYRMKRGEIREFFENTNVPMETFRLFLHLSNSKYISPRRDWYTTEKPEWAWMEIQEYLQANGYIIPDSAAGSHSWLWNGSAWEHLKAYWGAGLHVREMPDMHVYTTTPPPSEEVGSD